MSADADYPVELFVYQYSAKILNSKFFETRVYSKFCSYFECYTSTNCRTLTTFHRRTCHFVMEFELPQNQANFGSVATPIKVSRTPSSAVKRRRRSSSTSSFTAFTTTASSPLSKENLAKTPPTANQPSSCPKRRRNVSVSGSGCRTFWGWSPTRGRFKPKVKDKVSGAMIDPPDSEVLSTSFKSKWLQVSFISCKILTK